MLHKLLYSSLAVLTLAVPVTAIVLVNRPNPEPAAVIPAPSATTVNQLQPPMPVGESLMTPYSHSAPPHPSCTQCNANVGKAHLPTLYGATQQNLRCNFCESFPCPTCGGSKIPDSIGRYHPLP